MVEKLTSLGMKQVLWVGKYEADKIAQGIYEVGLEAGNYALVFDNTFSKNISKTITLFLLTYPSLCQGQIQFGAQVHHSQAMASAMSSAPSLTSRFSPKLKARTKESTDSLKTISAFHPLSAPVPSVPEAPRLGADSTIIYTGVLQKRRRKKRQGYARRFFSLDFSTSTLSYYHDRNSSKLRGSIPLSLAAMGANAKTREISIDSGAEIWLLKANNQHDFEEWKRALENASRLINEKQSEADSLGLHTDIGSNSGRSPPSDEDWANMEAILSRISGIRDAVRRLCNEVTSNKTSLTSSPGPDSGPTTPTETTSDEYFRPDDRRPFWKRKASANSSQTSIFKRSVSTQFAVPPPNVEPAIRSAAINGSLALRSPPVPNSHGLHRKEEDIYDHCFAILRDIDVVTKDFSTFVTEHRRKRLPAPQSAVSRVSIQSIESQEFFDADDGRASTLLTIQHDSDEEGRAEYNDAVADDDSITSSDVDGDEAYRQKFDTQAKSIPSILPSRSQYLPPLPLDLTRRRTTVAAPTIMPPSLIGFLRKNVGKDLSTISMPVSSNEPISLLQRAAEQFEYSNLLDQAAKATDALERLIYTTAFAISTLSSSRVKERNIRKPFNPMLGETFELVREDHGFRFLAEKVSHRPLQLAFLAESARGWALTQSPLPSQKFWGKSSEIVTEGKARVVLYESAEYLSWCAPASFLRNIIAGEKYVEPVGSMTIVNETTGHKAVVTFKSKGMFSGRSEELDVHTFDAHGSELALGLQGMWTQELRLKEQGHVTDTVIWRAGALVDNAPKHYGMTRFAAQLNEITPIEQNYSAPTDSRFRPDQRALEEGKHEQAEELKNALEEKQRARRRAMESRGEEWSPRWFVKVDDTSVGGETNFKMRTGKEGYWEERQKGTWEGVTNVLEV